MIKTPSAFAITLTLTLVACRPTTPAVLTPAPPAVSASSSGVTVIRATVSAATASVGTGVPAATSGPSATATPSPPPVPPPSGVSLTELKYAVLDQFPNFFFCDPDYYPVARANEADLARQRFPELQANAEEFQAILKHTGLGGLAAFTDEQKLLIYREHKKLAAIRFEPSGDKYSFQLQVKESDKRGFLVKGVVDSGESVTVQERQPSFPTCPICLAAHTRIDTPRGPVAVEDLRAGDVVWTADASGKRLAVPILKTAHTAAPAGHQMVHIILDDGRELWASPGHPMADGRALGDLKPGDGLDGARVSRLERVAYDQPATYDLLPAGKTGFYWANGILLGSTLATD
jgi:hypothetical protein